MSSKSQDIAAALIVKLEAGEAAGLFSRKIKTTREWTPLLALEDIEEISVQCVPVGSVRKRESNGTWTRDVRVDIVCQKKTPGTQIEDGYVDVAWIDDHVSMLEEIDDYLADPNNADLTDEAYYLEPGRKDVDKAISSKLGVDWSPQALTENRFYGVVTVAYRVTETY